MKQLILSFLKKIILLNVAFLFVGLGFRIIFLVSFGPWTELAKLPDELLNAFVLGARFDLTVLCYINSIPVLWMLILSLVHQTHRLQNLKKFLIYYYSFMLFIVVTVSAMDLGFYSYFQDHLNIIFFGLWEDDAVANFKIFWKNYPFVTILTIFIFMIVLMHQLIRWHFQFSLPKIQVKSYWDSLKLSSIFFSVFLVNGLGARGSLGLFPLTEMDTGISQNIFINKLSFNGVRSLARATELKLIQKSKWDSNIQNFGYGQNINQAFADYYRIPLENVPTDPLSLMKHVTPKNIWAEQTRPHVLFIVMESWGAYWLKYNQEPFNLMGEMKKHVQEDTLLMNFTSNSNGTIGTISTIMAGTHQRPIGEYLTESEYLNIPMRTSPAGTYKRAGYETRFVYGGNPGWRDINKYAITQGFDYVDGQEVMEKSLGPLKEVHDWGVYDEDTFDYILKTLESAKKPTFMLALTTTNHPPYQLPKTHHQPSIKIPDELELRLIGDKKIPPQRFATYRYSMDELAKLMTKIKNSTLKDKLIVAVTGDHMFWVVDFPASETLQKSSVPFYLYTPPAATQKKIPLNTFGNHSDIIPTLYHLSLSEQQYDSLSDNLFEKKSHFAMSWPNTIVGETGGILVNTPHSLFLDWDHRYSTLRPTEEIGEKSEMLTHFRSLMSIIDYYYWLEKKQHASHK